MKTRSRGWNLKKGAKDAPSIDELRLRAKKGGSRTGTIGGFSDPEVLKYAVEKSIAIRAARKSKKGLQS